MTVFATKVFRVCRAAWISCAVAGVAGMVVLGACSDGASGDASSTESTRESIEEPNARVDEAPVGAYPELFNGMSGQDEWTVSHAVEDDETCLLLDYLAESTKACATPPVAGDSRREPIVPMHYHLASDHQTMLIVGLVPEGTETIQFAGATEQVVAKVNSEYGVFILSGSASAEATAIEIVLGQRTISCDVDGRQLRDLTYFCN